MRQVVVFLLSFLSVTLGVYFLRSHLANGDLRPLNEDQQGLALLSSGQRAPSNLSSPSISDDGRRIAYLDSKSRLMAWERGAGNIVLDDSQGMVIAEPSMSADGRRIFYLLRSASATQLRVWEEGFRPRVIEPELGAGEWKVRCSPSGESALVYLADKEKSQASLYQVVNSAPGLLPNELDRGAPEFSVLRLDQMHLQLSAVTDHGLALVSDNSDLQKTTAFRVATPYDIDLDGGADILTFAAGQNPPLWRAFTLSGFRGVVPQVTGVPQAMYSWRVGHGGGIPITGDFNGDGINDFATFLPSFGVDWQSKQDNWLIYLSSPSEFGQGRFASPKSRLGITWGWGHQDSIATPGDFDGDNITDLAVLVPSKSEWHVLLSGGGFQANKAIQGQATSGRIFRRGQFGDIPIIGDYNGDGRDELALARFRDGALEWHLFYFPVKGEPEKKPRVIRFGKEGDIPLPSDVNGDGKTDMVLYRPSEQQWYIRASHHDIKKVKFGFNGASPLVVDFDADGKDDLAFYTPSGGVNWLIRSSRFAHAEQQIGERAPVIHKLDWSRVGEEPIQLLLREHQWQSYRSKEAGK